MDIYTFFNSYSSLLIFIFSLGSIFAGFHMDYMYRNKRDSRFYNLFIARFINYAIASGLTLAVSPIISMSTSIIGKYYTLTPAGVLRVEFWSGIFTWVMLVVSIIVVLFDFNQNLAQKFKFEKYVKE